MSSFEVQSKNETFARELTVQLLEMMLAERVATFL
jgi:hypothetical protein